MGVISSVAKPQKVDAVTIDWWPQERQLDFLRAVGLSHPFDGGEPKPPMARIVGYGGAAGGGKSDALLMAAVVACLTYPGAQVGYFRRTFPELNGAGGAIMRSLELLAPLKGARYKSSDYRWLFPNGSVLYFCHCKEEDDVYNYMSQQFDVLAFDEATHNTPFIVTYLLTRNRLTRPMPSPICMMASNPGNIGHLWFNRLFCPEEESVVRQSLLEGGSEPITTYFVPAKLEDNQILEKRDPSYRKNLEAQPEHIKEQLLNGRWNVFAGQMFSEFNPAVHVVRPFEIPKWWRRWRSNDPGFTDPFAWYWFATDGQGTTYLYREYTRSPGDPKLTYSDQARQVAELSTVGEGLVVDEATGAYRAATEKIDYTVTGMDAFTKHPETGKAILDYYREGGVDDCIQPVHGQGARKNMAATWHEYLKVYDGPDGKPTAKLKIFNTCRKLIETMPLQLADTHFPEQVQDSNLDHWYQAAGYGLQSHHAKRSEAPPPPATDSTRLIKHKASLAKQLSRSRKTAY